MGLAEKAVVSETKLGGSQDPTEVKPKSSWKGYLWDTWALPQDQRRLLFKLDAFVLTFASIGYFLKNLDQTNVNNAFLSGMKEDLQMYSNELVTSTSTSVKSYRSLYALRFLVGLFESGFYPGIHYMLGSWYTPREIGKRAMVFWLAGSIGQMFSGFLQAAAYTNLSGKGGLAGWQWLFIVDGIITIPLALAGFVFFPNMPGGGKTWWITEAENTLSVERMNAVGRAGKQPWTRAKVKKILSSWHTYLLPLCYVVWNNGWAQPAMGYWLKSFNETPAPVLGTSFSVADINDLPLPTTGIFVVMSLLWGWASDGPCHGIRWPFIYVGAAITLLFSVLLRQMPLYENITGRMVVYWFSQIGNGAGPLILTWINEICSDDTEKRALIVALGNDLAYVVQAVAPNFVWKTTDFPAARKGYLWCIIMQVLLEEPLKKLQYFYGRLSKNKHAAIEGIPNGKKLIKYIHSSPSPSTGRRGPEGPLEKLRHLGQRTHKNAVEYMLDDKKLLKYIHGPPGTGKSYPALWFTCIAVMFDPPTTDADDGWDRPLDLGPQLKPEDFDEVETAAPLRTVQLTDDQKVVAASVPQRSSQELTRAQRSSASLISQVADRPEQIYLIGKNNTRLDSVLTDALKQADVISAHPSEQQTGPSVECSGPTTSSAFFCFGDHMQLKPVAFSKHQHRKYKPPRSFRAAPVEDTSAAVLTSSDEPGQGEASNAAETKNELADIAAGQKDWDKPQEATEKAEQSETEDAKQKQEEVLPQSVHHGMAGGLFSKQFYDGRIKFHERNERYLRSSEELGGTELGGAQRPGNPHTC
ncbi:hypothetical protein INS49_006413 [Diaporthe citri]|uniref:uncharacterized protein n=1 Tax=Diaporthe citri TaxID=83186 RepID=UPI001C808FBD|nr:uncharacterized protein INS49_006413 [Diaporthe citri]KAG6364809.1 hypothetical protein INS49_006413 [Diaporthe citri]